MHEGSTFLECVEVQSGLFGHSRGEAAFLAVLHCSRQSVRGRNDLGFITSLVATDFARHFRQLYCENRSSAQHFFTT